MPANGMNHDQDPASPVLNRRRRRRSALRRVRPKSVPDQSAETVAKLAEEGDYLYGIFEVTRLDQNAFAGLSMVNEDYYLSDEELIEYYTPGASIHEMDYINGKVTLRPVNEPAQDLLGVEVLVDGVALGYIEPRRSECVYRYLEDARIAGVQIFLGGGRYKQIVALDDSIPWERASEDVVTGKHSASKNTVAEGSALKDAALKDVALKDAALEETETAAAGNPEKAIDADEDDEQQLVVRAYNVPLYAYVCLKIRRNKDDNSNGS